MKTNINIKEAAMQIRRLLKRISDKDGILKANGIIFQVPREFAGQELKVDAENEEFFPFYPESVAAHPMRRITSASMLA